VDLILVPNLDLNHTKIEIFAVKVSLRDQGYTHLKQNHQTYKKFDFPAHLTHTHTHTHIHTRSNYLSSTTNLQK